jgi:hypothetical protein
MPVNMDPSKKRRRLNQPVEQPHAGTQSPAFGEETDSDREKDLADAESKNLWDATEVIDMDKA